MPPLRLVREVLHQAVGHAHDDQQHVDRESQADDRECFQDADAEEEKRKDVRPCLGLTGYRLDRFAGDDTVADRRAERNGGDDDAEREEGEGCNQRFRAQESTFRRMLVIVRDR